MHAATVEPASSVIVDGKGHLEPTISLFAWLLSLCNVFQTKILASLGGASFMLETEQDGFQLKALKAPNKGLA